ncbi:hypothetical protein MGO_02557, partial [Candida albicans P76055]
MKFSNVAAATVLASTSSACILPIVEGLLNCVFPRPPPTIPPSPCGGKKCPPPKPCTTRIPETHTTIVISTYTTGVVTWGGSVTTVTLTPGTTVATIPPTTVTITPGTETVTLPTPTATVPNT